MTQTEEVVRLTREVFGTDLVGLYLHGSAVLGGLRPHSDIDLLAVVARPTTAAERGGLLAELLRISAEPGGPRAGRPVELTVVERSEVSPWRFPPRREFQYGEWLRGAYERGEVPAPADDADLAPLLTMVLDAGTALFGPPPKLILDPVPYGDLVRAAGGGVPELLAGVETDTRNALLTLARIWTTLTTGTVVPKDIAAEWALERLPAELRPALAHARAVYLGETAEQWDGLRPGAAALAERFAEEIGRAAAEAVRG
jgi:predicted nucleotidyltransferase